MTGRRTDFQAWLWGEILLTGLLGASLALFITNPVLRTQFDLPQAWLVVQTAMALAGLLVAVLAAVRFSVDGRRVDLLLASGFLVSSLAAAVFAIGPLLGGRPLHRPEGWAALLGGIVGGGLVAVAPFLTSRTPRREWAIANAVAAAAIVLLVAWMLLRAARGSLPELSPGSGETQTFALTAALGLQALIDLVAVIGWGRRLARRGDDLARWLALGLTLQLFAALHLVFTPLRGTTYVAEGDFLRVLGFAVMLVGAWRAIRSAELGRVVAEERARVAREIHDGLAQYLFAVSTHATMLETGVAGAETDRKSVV